MRGERVEDGGVEREEGVQLRGGEGRGGKGVGRGEG